MVEVYGCMSSIFNFTNFSLFQMANTYSQSQTANCPNMHRRAGAVRTAMASTQTDDQPSPFISAFNSTSTVHYCCETKPPATITTSSCGSMWHRGRPTDRRPTSPVLPSKRIWGTGRRRPHSGRRTTCHKG